MFLFASLYTTTDVTFDSGPFASFVRRQSNSNISWEKAWLCKHVIIHKLPIAVRTPKPRVRIPGLSVGIGSRAIIYQLNEYRTRKQLFSLVTHKLLTAQLSQYKVKRFCCSIRKTSACIRIGKSVYKQQRPLDKAEKPWRSADRYLLQIQKKVSNSGKSAQWPM